MRGATVQTDAETETDRRTYGHMRAQGETKPVYYRDNFETNL